MEIKIRYRLKVDLGDIIVQQKRKSAAKIRRVEIIHGYTFMTWAGAEILFRKP